MFSVFQNPRLAGCYSPRIPGSSSSASYVPPPSAGRNYNGDIVDALSSSSSKSFLTFFDPKMVPLAARLAVNLDLGVSRGELTLPKCIDLQWTANESAF